MIDRWANRSARVLKLSNAALIDEFDALLDIEPRDTGAALRLEIIHEELYRRERAGDLTDDDWIMPFTD